MGHITFMKELHIRNVHDGHFTVHVGIFLAAITSICNLASDALLMQCILLSVACLSAPGSVFLSDQNQISLLFVVCLLVFE